MFRKGILYHPKIKKGCTVAFLWFLSWYTSTPTHMSWGMGMLDPHSSPPSLQLTWSTIFCTTDITLFSLLMVLAFTTCKFSLSTHIEWNFCKHLLFFVKDS